MIRGYVRVTCSSHSAERDSTKLVFDSNVTEAASLGERLAIMCTIIEGLQFDEEERMILSQCILMDHWPVERHSAFDEAMSSDILQ